MILWLIVVGVLILVVGGLFLMQSQNSWLKTERESNDPKADPIPGGKPCPLCGTLLQRGERVHSVQYASSLPEKEMEIWGCPHCYETSKALRLCPVCQSPVPHEEPVMARVFIRPGKRPHVHVLGCAFCRKKKLSPGRDSLKN